MVSIVIVSRSARLAEGVGEMAREMGGPELRLAATGGLALPGRPLGTDANQILAAIEQVYSDDGVVVLMDLGSAVMSAEMAVELLPAERRARVFLSNAPLVEGAIAAAAQARLGSPVARVLAEARAGLAAKGSRSAAELPDGHAGGEPAAPPSPAQTVDRQVRLKVQNRLGLHLRPAARFAWTASQFQLADIQVRNLTTGLGPVNAKSVNSLATLGARQGHEIQVSAAGTEAAAALHALAALADKNFGDPPDMWVAPAKAAPGAPPVVMAAASQADGWQGRPASAGIAMGPARLLGTLRLVVPIQATGDPAADWLRLEQAIQATRGQIKATQTATALRAGDWAAEIFAAHALFLTDDALLAPTRRRIFEERQNAAAAWQQTVDEVGAAYRALADPYQRARAPDVEAVGQQVLRNLLGEAARTTHWAAPGILVADDLTTAETARLDAHRVLGIVTAAGGPNSHSAILAQTLGIPAVVGVGQKVLALAEGTPLLLDGETGMVWPNPSNERQAAYGQLADRRRAARAKALAASVMTATTRDGQRVEVAANIGTPAEARQAVEMGADAVGLFRTEFLFLDRQTAPDEDEQYAAYQAAAEVLGQRPLTIRTLDVGGDKPLPYVQMAPEANPFLGFRAIRLCLARPDFFKVQLRAIVRAAAEHPLRVMFPMIATLDEFRAARALLLEARAEVARRGQRTPEHIEIGMMVEIPAAALRAELFAREADFFSVGTNDLAQYTLAAERGNAQLAALADGLHPAVLQLIAQTVKAAHAHDKQVSVCGELAGDAQAAPLLVGLGVDELSMSAAGIPRIKQLVRDLDFAEARRQAESALTQESAEAVRHALAASR